MNKLPLIASAALLLAACTTPQATKQVSDNPAQIKRVWMLVEMEGFSRDQLTAAKAKMDWTKLPRIHAYMGCNQLMFSAETMDDTGRIGFSSAAATRMYCGPAMQLEQTFLNKLDSINSYTVQGHELILNSPQGKPMRFIAEDWD
ncbi:META domain-containing protein [Neisseria canis]|uniref:META domain n=1 Tax=Neisseria canis TaxID=493 RepID=A0A448DAF6_9NEIS|nr:META domain-containing protein [Neisseria canis]VEF02741.1 META domain [Neisseria canis]